MANLSPYLMVLALAASSTILALRTPSVNASVPPPEIAPPAVSPAPAPEPAKEPAPASPPQTQAAPIPAKPWPHDASDIKPDPELTHGALPNGMRYIIRHNANPPGRLSMRLHIATGSLMEQDHQRGLAHFLEHMVFNGTKHYTAEELIPKMQRLGIGFGADANAYTSFDETVYKFDMLDLSPETLQLAFTVMRDFADGALLQGKEIEKERGVILAEKISRDTVSTRIMEQQFAKLMPDSRITHRFPIGIEPVIKSIGREDFVDFYSRYYVPSRMTFVLVGDIQPDVMKSRINEVFGSMTQPSRPGEDPNMGTIRQPEGLETAVFSDKELSSTDLTLFRVRAHQPKPDTSENRAADLPTELAHAALTRRFESLSKQPNSPIASGEAGKTTWFNLVDFGSISVTVANDRWQEAVPLLEQEFRRTLDYGFTQSEIHEAKANLLNAYQQAVEQQSTRKSEALANQIIRTLQAGDVVSTPETNLEIARKALDAITPETCHQAFREFWNAPGHDLVLSTKETQTNTEKDLAALYAESSGKPVDPPAERAIAPFAYQSFGTPSAPASSKSIQDLGITQLSYPNQVRINLKSTDFEKGRIRVLARIGSGKLSLPPDSPMLDTFAQAVFEGGGLGKHSNDELQQILAGRNASASFAIDEDAFTLSGSTTTADFPLQCQLICAAITDPGYREEGLRQFQKSIPMLFQQIRHTPAGPQMDMDAWLHGNDPRFAVATETQLNNYSIQDARKWLDPELSRGYLEISIVGDFNLDAIRPALDATFGALPKRAASPPALPEARKVKFPNAPAIQSFSYQSKIPQAVALVIWKTDGLRGRMKEFRRLNLLGQILGDRLREEVREKLGASYGPDAAASGSDALESFSYLVAQSIGKPDDLKTLLDTMRSQAELLSTSGASQDELDRALKPTLGQLEKTRRDNAYWLNTVLAQSQADPARLDLARNRDADYRSISLSEINTLARKYLTPDRALLVSIVPKTAP